MNTLIIVLRLIHIFGGVFWVGTSLLFDFFIIPSIRATDQRGQKFLGHLINTHIAEAHGISAILTVLAGAGLYWIDSGGFTSGWMTSGAGLGFGIGGIFGFLGVISGILNAIPLRTLAETAAQIQGSPTPEQMDKIQAAQKRLGVVGRIDSAVLIIALICMATARYWRFSHASPFRGPRRRDLLIPRFPPSTWTCTQVFRIRVPGWSDSADKTYPP